MTTTRFILLPVAATLAALWAWPAHAGVSAEEAAKLKTELTPFGAERAANKDGTIPAWTGGYSTPIPGDKAGGRRGDPFKDEKPLLSITAKNVDTYADKLTEGTRALLKKYPEYRVDVYPTHRTAGAPQWVYDNTFKNATRASLNNEIVTGAFGGIPFPIPKTGAEVLWNHMLRWRHPSYQLIGNQYMMAADGRAVLTVDGLGEIQLPYYMQDGSAEQLAKQYNNNFWMIRLLNIGPPMRAGEAVVGWTNLDPSKDQGWIYLTGQRRVRKLPNPCCDTPAPSTAGVMSFDEIEVFLGRTDRFDFKLLGKKEMYIPYNGNKLLQPTKDADVLGPGYLNPDHMRWELHRVWIVEGTLRAGQRHSVHRSRYYCDEDSWICVQGDRWDANGQLWRVLWGHTVVAPELPGLVLGAFGFTDLLSGQGFAANIGNQKNSYLPAKARFPDANFTPEALSGEGVR